MTQILLGQSYFLRFDPKLWEAMQPYPPLGTLYAASYLRQHGYEVALFDAMLAESEDEWGMALDDHKPQYAIIYEDNFNYLSKMCLLRMREAAFKMIDMAKSTRMYCHLMRCGCDRSLHRISRTRRGLLSAWRGGGNADRIAESVIGEERGGTDHRPGFAQYVASITPSRYIQSR